MAVYSAGPWTMDRGGEHIRAANNQSIARVYDVEPYSVAETGANALLIAAAPDLLEALKALVDYWDSGNFSRKPELAQQMKNAIAKAEGK